MKKVLIIGNLIKDIYLAMDPEKNHFESDSDGTPWLDLSFNASKLFYNERTAVLSGAMTALEVLVNLGFDAEISGKKVNVRDGQVCMGSEDEKCREYRYILNLDRRVVYLTSEARDTTIWQAPQEMVDYIYIDRTARITPEILNSIESYLSISRNTNLIYYVNNKKRVISESERRLILMSNLVFADRNIENFEGSDRLFIIKNRQILYKNLTKKLQIKKSDLKTDITTKAVVASTIFGALALNKTAEEAMELAKINAEKLSLSQTLSLNKLEEINQDQKNRKLNLRSTAKSLVDGKKGILAADESGGSIHKKFLEAGIPDDEKHRRDYRNIFFTTKDLYKYVNGVILFDETARQRADNGKDFVTYLTNLGIIPGIKVDQGLENFAKPEFTNEKWTRGLDGLEERLEEYYEMGLRFAKWRAAFEVEVEEKGLVRPSNYAISRNSEFLARYAKLCQEAGIVPIVEPEVVYDGYYPIEVCAKITGSILEALFAELKKQDVALEACILKTNMVLAGKKYHTQSTPQEVGLATSEVLKKHVPKDLAGVVFLSGGQGVEQATENLQAVLNNKPFPWPVTFSFARALQEPALIAWKGDNLNILEAKEAFLKRLVANTKVL